MITNNGIMNIAVIFLLNLHRKNIGLNQKLKIHKIKAKNKYLKNKFA